MKTLFEENGYPAFLYEISNTYPPDDSYITSMTIKVYEVVSWSADDVKKPLETELYIEAMIKWDGCSHWWSESRMTAA